MDLVVHNSSLIDEEASGEQAHLTGRRRVRAGDRVVDNPVVVAVELDDYAPSSLGSVGELVVGYERSVRLEEGDGVGPHVDCVGEDLILRLPCLGLALWCLGLGNQDAEVESLNPAVLDLGVVGPVQQNGEFRPRRLELVYNGAR